MNRKQLLLLLAALVLIGAAGLLSLQRNRKSWTESEAQIGRKLLNNYQINDVASIHIKGDSDLTLDHKDDGWRVRERGGYPANASQIKELLIKLGDLKISQSDPIGPSQLARMHLSEPGKGSNSAVLLELNDTGGKPLQSILLGKKHTHQAQRPSQMPYGDEGFADGRYVMLAGDPKTVLTIHDALDNVEPRAANWLDKDFLKIEKLRAVSFVSTNASQSWSLSRQGESAPWTLADLKPGEVFDSNKVSSLSSALSYPSFVDVAPDAAPDKTGLDKPLIVTIETFDSFTYTLKIGRKTQDNDYNINISVSANFPAARTPGKDEKADAKAKLEKEFQEKTKQLQDRLKKEQSLARWTYLVNSWLVDPFIRDRAQLMVDKQTDKKDQDEEKDQDAASGAKPAPEPDEPETIPAPAD